MTFESDHQSFALLYVDDEEQALKYFRMAFEKDFHVATASSVDAAWAIVEAANPPVGVLVTDQRMPDKTGTQLLQRVRRSHPDIVRLLATAYSDLDAAIDAVNSGAIYKYLVKPWDVRDLRMTLRRAMDYFLLKRERDLLLREKLSSLQHLLVADRIRSLAILAEGLSSQIRNTMTALSAYVELAREQAAREPKATASAEERWRNLRWETEDATGHLLRLVQRITAATMPSRYEFDDQVALADLIESSWGEARREAPSQHARLDLDVATDLPPLRCNRAMLERT
ncbi:MAG TPA: response regulator, partial [Polyangiaceae bacterium]|nr:response regulator [Polyangiaceae bacterium]